MAKAFLTSTQQIGKLGELLVQYKLLTFAVDSSPMTTDSGIDLVAYGRPSVGAKTIQVKTNLQPKPGGGKGKQGLDWWIPVDSPAQLLALADVSASRVWLFTMAELAAHAQQESSGRFHLYMYTDESVRTRSQKLAKVSEFEPFLLESRVSEFFL